MILKNNWKLDFENDHQAFDKREELKAMDITADALITFARRHAEKLEELSEKKTEQKENKNSMNGFYMSSIFWHLLHMFQWSFTVLFGSFIWSFTELNPMGFIYPGRLDQHLSILQKIERGILTRKEQLTAAGILIKLIIIRPA